ncbi:MAG: cysteine-rich CWC family protein [Burkholderiaceae bacterium]|nr:cysteine-rich CWC family protein [Burkholderiaceae bacterium]
MKPHPHSSINAALAARECPLCGQPNQCDMALGKSADNCWCMETPMSLTALAVLLAAERTQRCICPACARGQHNAPR